MDARRKHMTGSTMDDAVIVEVVYSIMQSISESIGWMRENSEGAGAWREVVPGGRWSDNI